MRTPPPPDSKPAPGSGPMRLDAVTLDGRTLPRVRPGDPEQPAAVDVGLAPVAALAAEGPRYEMRELLGEGGMGAVRLCRDRLIGRDVAMKVIRRDLMARGDVRARFEREARVQGQLEHPAVVPIYDLGTGPDGAAFFTMKRVRGVTLEEIIDGLEEGRPELVEAYTARRLLTVFSGICLAVAFAHARGVIHRDLKPDNIMLGEYGETHILDWGLAKLLGAGEDPIEDDPSMGTTTMVGEILGTPGYMAPEQLRGEVDAQGPATDVYALGAILFELLTLEPLHTGSTLEAVYTSTLKGADARPSARAPARAVPPELDDICVRATAIEPAQRFPSALDLHAAIERYLEGDRDLAQRRKLAEAHAAEAARAAEAAAQRGAAGDGERRRALKEATAALALDPNHQGALRTFVQLLVEAPAEIPSSARAELEASRRDAKRLGRRASILTHAIWLGFTALAAMLGVRGPWYIVVIGLLALELAGIVWLGFRQAGPGARLAVHLLGTVVIAITSLWMGPYIVVPSLAAAYAMNFMLWGDRRFHEPAIAASFLAACGPPVLQALGLLPNSYVFRDGAMCVQPLVTDLPPVGTSALLFLSSAGLVVLPALVAKRIVAKLEELEERQFIQTRLLRHLVPDTVRGGGVIR